MNTVKPYHRIDSNSKTLLEAELQYRSVVTAVCLKCGEHNLNQIITKYSLCRVVDCYLNTKEN